MSAASINSVGLFLDILGVILLFRFALPSRVIEGPPVLSFGEGPDSTKQREKQQKWSKFWSCPWARPGPSDSWFRPGCRFRLSVTTACYPAMWITCYHNFRFSC